MFEVISLASLSLFWAIRSATLLPVPCSVGTVFSLSFFLVRYHVCVCSMRVVLN